jgi:hypothetical protein
MIPWVDPGWGSRRRFLRRSRPMARSRGRGRGRGRGRAGHPRIPHPAATSSSDQEAVLIEGREARTSRGEGVERWKGKVGLGHWCGAWCVECRFDAQMHRRLSITIITVHMVARALAAAAGGWEAARRLDDAQRGALAVTQKWALFVVCGAIAIAAVQHAQDRDAGPRLQLASSRQRRRVAAAGNCGELGGAARARCTRAGAHSCKLIWTQIL